MDAAGIDVSIVSLTCPNVYWGGEDVSSDAARESNASMAEAQRRYQDRIRWFTSLPWEYPTRAVEELRRSYDEGAVGVMVIANVAGRSLTEPAFAPIWAEIDRRALPVLIHPGEPPGSDVMDMGSYDLSWLVGFMFDTTLAVTRMIFDGFLDRYAEPQAHRSARRRHPPLPRRPDEKGDEVELPARRRMTAPPTRVPPPHLVRLHHVRPRRAALPHLGRRRRPRPVRHGLAAPGPRRRGIAREHRRPPARSARGDPWRECPAALPTLTRSRPWRGLRSPAGRRTSRRPRHGCARRRRGGGHPAP